MGNFSGGIFFFAAENHKTFEFQLRGTEKRHKSIMKYYELALMWSIVTGKSAIFKI